MNALRLQHLEGRRRQNGVCGNCGQLSHCLPDNIDAHRLVLLEQVQEARPCQSGRPGSGRDARIHRRGGGMKDPARHAAPGRRRRQGACSPAAPPCRKRRCEQTFLLLEEPRDRRYAEMIEAGGARVIVADGLDQVARLAGAADIVQFEFWNHPRLFECLAHCAFPAMRSVFWSHISGLSKPLIPPGLMEEAGRFVFTTEASRSIPSIAVLPETARKKIAVINSGFGFSDGSDGERHRKTENPSLRISGPLISSKCIRDFSTPSMAGRQ